MDDGKKEELLKLDIKAENNFVNDESSTATDLDELDEKDDVDWNERESWGGRFEFVLSLVGYTVGLGNIWRFPYFCFRNGGGIAIIPFLLFLIICGGPLYYIEVCLGQFSGKSPITVWNICPLFKGIGLLMVTTSLFYVWYFGTAFGWVFYFLIMSFYPTLPWSTCNNSWNTENCIDSTTNMTMKLLNVSSGTLLMSSGTEFWERKVLNMSSGIEDIGSLQLHLVGCLFLGWLLVFFCLAKGVKSLGKVVYVTATLPYVLLLILLIRGVTLDGAWIGLRHYVIPDFSKLANGKMWIESAVQCFYSLGPAWGGVITMASFNKFNHNALRDTVIVCFADAFTAIFGGFVVFSVLGFLSKETGTSLDKLPFAGPGLAFIAYPEALSRLPAPNLWSVLFFTTLVMVGIDSQFGTFETGANALIDLNFKKFSRYRIWISASLTSCLFVLGLPLTTSGGYYIFMLIDWYVALFGIVFTALLECVIVAWIYGAGRFSDDIEMMTGSRPSQILRFIWCFCIPIFIGGILITTISTYTDSSIGYDYPEYALVIGNILAFGPCSLIAVVAVVQLVKEKGTLCQRLSNLLRPDKTWLPNDKQQRQIYRHNPYDYEDSLFGRFKNNVVGLKH
ncbi:sodium- and chloride-dependent glycine transporter 1-like [Ruditapes philippinarum]|uniref:sodium- and chloride-dependent glycine transporter 1-like n=1 Tax=Ruditapes philippinarum TaxID=129788 RepID=UPI00295B6924|nr:sodium- and chloride-dependent glycine transporter 1-like [Ruditapes philippinarum]XP_060591214.1 sodium- and chloride-dependent glycine transporter 1-like [Ruditapes philippinarum]